MLATPPLMAASQLWVELSALDAPRSLVATATFIATGAIVVYLVNHILGGQL